MTLSLVRPSRALAATALFGALMLSGASYAQTANSTTTTTTAAPAPSKAVTKTSTSASTGQTVSKRVEARIAELHKKLRITAEEEPKWNEVAQTMRDNAQKMDTLIEQRHQNLKSMTAVEDLRSYQQIADQHAKGLDQLIAAFQGLYDEMTPDQKKNADVVFAQVQGPRKVANRTSKGS